MDFEEAERSEPTQALELTPDDIKEESIIQLRYVKFQNVQSVTVSTKPILPSFPVSVIVQCFKKADSKRCWILAQIIYDFCLCLLYLETTSEYWRPSFL